MIERRLLDHAVRSALMAGAAVTAAGYASPAPAANANTPAQLHKVTVTGTRIKRSNIETAQPITRISRQQIQESGYTNVGTLLGQLSFAGARSTTYNGTTTTVSLRGLGSARNLVLVNGKRWFQSLGTSTNLDTIPTSLIDHIEVLQDGASAVYGSDAISGVVNIITVKNFNGAEAHAYYGIRNDSTTGSWDSQVKQYDFTIGSGSDRGNVVFNATYREQNGTFNSARKLTSTPIAGVPGHANATTPRGRFQLFGPAVSGKTFGQGTCGTYNPARPTKTLCDLTLIDAPALPSLQNFKNYDPVNDGYNGSTGYYLTSPYKDVDLYVQGHYDLFDNVTFSATAAYVRDEANINYGFDSWRVGSKANWTPANGQHIGISGTNPYNPFGVDLVADSSDPCIAAGTCIGLSHLQRRSVEAGHRHRETDRDYFYISAGFNGYVNLFNREIDWNVGFMQNRDQEVTMGSGGSASRARIAKALGPAAQCTAPCAPLNFFGGSVVGDGGSITQKQLDFIGASIHNVYQSNIRDWTANLSSDVYNLPAGPLGVAIGWERIDNYGYNHPDALLVEHNWSDGGGGHPAFDGRVVRDAEYAEINIPLLADRPGVKSLSVDVANRWTQFKRSGGVTGQTPATSFVHNSSGRLNIRYQPIKDLLLRASWSQGFRSPNVNLLFHGQSSSFSRIVDPCAPPPNGNYQGGPLPPNCPNGTEDFQTDRFRPTIGGSNPNLEAEKSISRTVGFVYSPSQVPGLDVNADYFKIEVNNAIGTVGVQNIIDGCFEDFSFCNLVSVGGNEITTVRNVNTNRGSLLTEGIDAGLHYKFPSTPFGDFTARINGTFVTTFDETNINRATKTGFATSHLVGSVDHPNQRLNGYLDWDYGNWSAQYHIEYISDSVNRCTVAIKGYCTYPNRTTNYQGVPGKFGRGRQHLGTTVYHDVHVAYTVPSINTTLALGVNNLFDKKPPINGGGGFNLGLYRLPSRLIYGSLRVRF